ncbi:contractile injection system tape measure protein [Photorhabdus sp. P32]|uniref:contractile injection system tape measure protein n=1 Tax=Photorhabdus sp. P32 TaxID=3117549 RepID=UPI00311AD6BE
MSRELNLLDRIIITIEANNLQAAKKVLHDSLLNKADIHKLLNSFFNERIINQNIHLKTLTLDLGEISLNNFDAQFPILFNAAFSQALGRYQTDNKEQSAPQKFTNNIQLSNNIYPINIEEFIYDLYQIDSSSNPMENIANNKITNSNIQQLINQLTKIDSNLTLLLAKICLSERSLQRLLAIEQPDLFGTISLKLSEKINKQQYKEKFTSPVQLILHSLEYIQRNNIQNIPKPDTKVILRIAARSKNIELNSKSIIELFRQAVIANNSSLNEWLEQLWQIESISQLCQKHLSDQEYQKLVNCFSYTNQPEKEPSSQQKISANMILTEILQLLSTEHQQNLLALNQHQLSLIATAIQQREIEIDNILQLFNHPALDNKTGTNWLSSLWQLTPVAQLCKAHFTIEEYQYLSQRFMPEHTDKNTFDKQPTIHKSPIKPILSSHCPTPNTVNNAGILILWPMLPVLFSQLSLLKAQKFIHRQAQFNAADSLDYLIWGTEETQAERNKLNYILCGLTVNENSKSMPIEPEKQLIIEQRLDAIIAQLPGWKKLSRNDARQLFLQRPGELLINKQETKITIQIEPFDALLADWPWPLNIAKLPWLDHPLLIDWQNI